MTVGILNGIAYLHHRGVIHRDLKPGNILLQGNTPRITDFGLARLSGTLKHSFSIAGTPEYMAPEAWHGNRSAQTDLWSVSVMFYEMLCGHNPFPCDNWEILRHAVAVHDPEPLPHTVPARIRNIILKSLQKDPQNRFASAEEMLASLNQPSMHSPYIRMNTVVTSNK
jgi:serine/threonine-protein kinase